MSSFRQATVVDLAAASSFIIAVTCEIWICFVLGLGFLCVIVFDAAVVGKQP